MTDEAEARLREIERLYAVPEPRGGGYDVSWLISLVRDLQAQCILAGVQGAKDGDEIASIYKAEKEHAESELRFVRAVVEAATAYNAWEHENDYAPEDSEGRSLHNAVRFTLAAYHAWEQEQR